MEACGWRRASISAERSQFLVGHLISWCSRRLRHVESKLAGEFGRIHFGCASGGQVATARYQRLPKRVAPGCLVLHFVTWPVQMRRAYGRCLLTRCPRYHGGAGNEWGRLAVCICFQWGGGSCWHVIGSQGVGDWRSDPVIGSGMSAMGPARRLGTFRMARRRPKKHPWRRAAERAPP